MKSIATSCLLLISAALFAQVNPLSLGETYFSESYYFEAPIFTQQNRVYACDSLGLVAFIHHENSVGVGLKKMRLDISTNKGQTFTNDIGGLQSNFLYRGAMPQCVGMNPNNTQNPLSAKLLWTATNLDAALLPAGIVSGVSNIVTSGNLTSTENTALNMEANTHSGGLCQGKPNEYWMAQHKSFSGSSNPFYEDTLYLFKGTYNSTNQDVNWNIEHRIYIPYDKSFDGTPKTGMPNMAFSPDGMMGWCVFIADLQGGMDSTKTIVYLRTIDGGQSWSYPQEVDLWQLGNLTSVFINNPEYADFEPGFDGDFDISVDKYGDLHCFAHFLPINGVDYSPAYTTPLGNPIWHSMVDITTTTGGFNWLALEISTAYTFYSNFSTSFNIQMRLQPQMSRTEDGQFVFYAWVDSDTSQFAGIPGIGYGEIRNLAPNLRIEGMNVDTQAKLGKKNITGMDIVWEGRACFPTMAPTVIRSGNKFRLPIVLAEPMNGSSFINEQGKFWYFGNDATLDDPTVSISTAEKQTVRLFPNPAQNYLTLQTSWKGGDTQWAIFDITGKTIYQGNLTALEGQNTIDIHTLDEGMYFYQVIAHDQTSQGGTFIIQR